MSSSELENYSRRDFVAGALSRVAIELCVVGFYWSAFPFIYMLLFFIFGPGTWIANPTWIAVGYWPFFALGSLVSMRMSRQNRERKYFKIGYRYGVCASVVIGVIACLVCVLFWEAAWQGMGG